MLACPPLSIDSRINKFDNQYVNSYRECVDGIANTYNLDYNFDEEDLIVGSELKIRIQLRYEDHENNNVYANSTYIPVTAQLDKYDNVGLEVDDVKVLSNFPIFDSDQSPGLVNIIDAVYYGTSLTGDNSTMEYRMLVDRGGPEGTVNTAFTNWTSGDGTRLTDISLSDPRWCEDQPIGSNYGGDVMAWCQSRLKDASGSWITTTSNKLKIKPASTMGTVSIADDSGTDPASISAGGDVTFTASHDGDVDMPYYVWSVRESDLQYVESSEVLYEGTLALKRAHKFKVTLKADVAVGTNVIVQCNAYSALCTDTTQQTLTETIVVLS